MLLLRSVRMSDERDRDSIEADWAALLRDSVTGDVGWKSTDTCRLELETKVIRRFAKISQSLRRPLL